MLLVVLAGPFLAGTVHTHDDLGAFHLPIRAFYAEQLARGEPFDWMPQLLSGFYLTGEGQLGGYHPLHMLLYRHLPFRAALGLEWLATYPFMLLGSWLFLRRALRRSDAETGITPQLHSGSGTPNAAAFRTDQNDPPPRCRSTVRGEISTDSIPAARNPNSR